MIMKKLFFIVLIVVSYLSTSVFANEVELEKGIISGKVVDQNTALPIPYATVVLLSPVDSSLITGVISDSTGNYIINDVSYGNYDLQVAFVGYKPSTLKNIDISRVNRKVELSPMALSVDVAMLDEVVVTQERLKGEEKIDRTVFTLNDDVKKTAVTGLDVLKQIPSVTVDFQENVTLEGESNIQFYVDGVLRNKDYVAQLNPKLIDKVELITNPGVKYDADISGIINIVLTKEKRFGISGSVNVPLPHPQKIVANPRVNLEYGTNKYRVYAGTRLHVEKFPGGEYLYTRLDNTFETPFENERLGSGTNRWINNYTNYGIDFFLNDKTSLNFYGEWR